MVCPVLSRQNRYDEAFAEVERATALDPLAPGVRMMFPTVALPAGYNVVAQGAMGEDFRVIASGIYDKVRNDPRFKAGLQQIRTQVYDRVQRPRRGVGLK